MYCFFLHRQPCLYHGVTLFTSSHFARLHNSICSTVGQWSISPLCESVKRLHLVKVSLMDSCDNQFYVQSGSRGCFCRRVCIFNSFRSSGTIWRLITWSVLVWVMVWCLMAPSYRLYQCWLIILEVLWHSAEGNFTGTFQDMFPWYAFETYWFNVTITSASSPFTNMD